MKPKLVSWGLEPERPRPPAVDRNFRRFAAIAGLIVLAIVSLAKLLSM